MYLIANFLVIKSLLKKTRFGCKYFRHFYVYSILEVHPKRAIILALGFIFDTSHSQFKESHFT